MSDAPKFHVIADTFWRDGMPRPITWRFDRTEAENAQKAIVEIMKTDPPMWRFDPTGLPPEVRVAMEAYIRENYPDRADEIILPARD